MGDRANVNIKEQENDCGVFLYTHWAGSELAYRVHAALKKNERWDDPPYLARIVFCRMLNGDTDGTTGLGISTRIGDNSHPIITLDCEDQAIYLAHESGKEIEQTRMKFEEFVKLDIAALDAWYAKDFERTE